MITKIKSNIVFLLVQVLIDIFWYFILILSLKIYKSQPNSSIKQELWKNPYVDCGKSVSIATKFNSKKLFPDLLVFINKKDPTIE